MHRMFSLEWDAIAGIVAAVIALVLHFLHVVETDVLQMITLVLIALLFVRSLRGDGRLSQMEDSLSRGERTLDHLVQAATPPDALLIGPRQLRVESERFTERAQGEMIWFHVCLTMFKPQALFDALLRPALTNPDVTVVRFVLDEDQRELWQTEVWPKVVACKGTTKVPEPTWVTMRESVSFILSDTKPTGTPECLLSFWGEPFMSRVVGRDVPRYIFHVQQGSELLGALAELERNYRLSA